MGDINEVEIMEIDEERENVNGCEVIKEIDGDEEVRWEDFMPRMVLRVLLVEADDSTRHIISALLRKCNYKVAAISDGLKAWEILKRRHTHIDLVLTELDLPSISGYALLTLIMEHDSCKNIPVIVMSAQDSISMVLKCMLKGAADFLIKPVRKNELKNLWRHVWRRLTVNAGQSSPNLICEQYRVATENNTAANQSSDNVSTSRKGNKSDYVTDSQDISGMKSTEETVLRHKEMKHEDEDVKLQKTLAQHSKDLEDTNDMEELRARLDSGDQVYKGSNVSAAPKTDEDGSCTGLATDDGSVDQDRSRATTDGLELPDTSQIAIDLICGINNQKCNVVQSSSNGELTSLKSNPELDLSLRRLHDSEVKDVDERHTLNHSSASAFSRYSTSKKSLSILPSPVSELTETIGLTDSSLWPKKVSASEENEPTQGSDVAVPQPAVEFGGGLWTGYSPMSFSHQVRPSPDPPARSPKSAFYREESPFLTSASLHSDQMTRSSTVDHSSVQEGHEFAARESVERYGYSSSQVIDQSGSSTPCNDFTGQYKASASGSTSEVTDSNAASQGMLETTANEKVPKIESCNAFNPDQFRHRTSHHSAERAAALAKFRLKRKGRCFEKKVRYQSRQKLAEQRPRVKGQFIRQVPTEQMSVDDE